MMPNRNIDGFTCQSRNRIAMLPVVRTTQGVLPRDCWRKSQYVIDRCGHVLRLLRIGFLVRSAVVRFSNHSAALDAAASEEHRLYSSPNERALTGKSASNLTNQLRQDSSSRQSARTSEYETEVWSRNQFRKQANGEPLLGFGFEFPFELKCRERSHTSS